MDLTVIIVLLSTASLSAINTVIFLVSFLSCLYSLQTVSVGRRTFSADFQLFFRLIKFLIFVAFTAILIVLIVFLHMTFRDIFVCFLAFLPTGWGILLVRHSLAFSTFRLLILYRLIILICLLLSYCA
jgi:hypothetical protein